jgi:tetratricopeptide (TPR) repeat protein
MDLGIRAFGAALVLNPPPQPDDSGGAAAPESEADASVERDPTPLGGGAPGFALPAPASEIVAIDGPSEPAASVSTPASVRRARVRSLTAAALTKLAARDVAGALDLLAEIVNLDPESFVAHGNYAIVLRQAKRAAEAEAHARRAAALKPDFVQNHKILAELLTDRRDIDGALAAYDRIIALEPDNAAAHNNAGLLLRKIRRPDEAHAAFERAYALRPDQPQIRFNLTMMRRDDAGLEDAMAFCRQSLEGRPDNADVLTNLAVCQQFSGRYEEALENCARACAIDPDHREARFDLSLLQLLRGDYERGWRNYEHRWRLLEVIKPRFSQPEWTGEDLAGRTILLQTEQGIGDMIQCLRYVGAVAARGGRILLRIDRPLVRLAASLPERVTIVPPGAPVPAFDVWCPMLSLPGILGTRPDNIPAQSYLHARSAIVERWRRRLAGLAGLKVGLVWAGSPTHINDYRRSIGIAPLRPLLDIPGISFVSLQVGPRAAECAALSPDITDLSSELTDLAETAGAIASLDLVIAVDTAVVHLAGALGRPAWVLLPFSPDWRWMLERADSLWYPTLKLYRQRAPGDWAGVVARVAADLRDRASGHAGAATEPTAAP